jgi:hypothetical protein
MIFYEFIRYALPLGFFLFTPPPDHLPFKGRWEKGRNFWQSLHTP